MDLLEITTSDITLYEIPISRLLGTVHQICQGFQRQSPCRLLLQVLESFLRVYRRQWDSRWIKVTTDQERFYLVSAFNHITETLLEA